MKIFATLSFLLVPFSFYANLPNICELPWIKAKDVEAIHFAGLYLPPNPVIVEAGVGHGDDTIRMKEKWPQAKIYCFEPHPGLFSLATNNTKMLSNVKISNCALYDHIGEIPFNASARIPEASSVLRDNLKYVTFPKDLQWTGEYEDSPISVKCTTLNYWAADKGVYKVDFLWLDTEGAELTILQNATDILPSVRVISTEVNFLEFRKGMTLFEPLYDFLTKKGFVIKFIWGRSDWQGVAVFVNARYL